MSQANLNQLPGRLGAACQAVGEAVIVDAADELWGHWGDDALCASMGLCNHGPEYAPLASFGKFAEVAGGT